MQNIIKRLTPEGVDYVNTEFLRNKESFVPNESKFCAEIERKIFLDKLDKIIDNAITKYEPFDIKIDEYLAPLLHKELGLTRRESADREIWSYLTCVKYPQFVFHRWKPKINGEVGKERFIDRRRNTFTRLWLVAELTYNGTDYSLTEKFFHLKDSQERLNAFFDRRVSWSYFSTKVLINELGDKDRDYFRNIFVRVRQVLTTSLFESLDEKQFEILIQEVTSKY